MRSRGGILGLLCLGFAFVLAPCGLAQRLRVAETAGLRRFTYPVTVKLPAGLAGGRLRLREGEKPVPAQFRSGELDFNVSLGPYEQKEYIVEPGGAPDAGQGAPVREQGDLFLVSFTPALEFAASRNLLGFLASVKTARWDYLAPGGEGLLLRSRNGASFRAGGLGNHGEPTRARLVKQGPLACAIEFSSAEPAGGSRTVLSQVRMDFPRSKSWVKTTWTIEDPENLVSALGVALRLNLGAPPALVDFGAGSLVYAQLRAGQEASLLGGPQSWKVLLGGEPYALGRGAAEGWAHIMDRERAVAAAIEDFGGRRDRIEAGAGGLLRLWHEVSGAGTKTFTFWLHFVSMPVQIGAATSPQAMLSPLRTEWN
jgi:hypothetical protein